MTSKINEMVPPRKGKQPLEKSIPVKKKLTFTDQLRVSFKWILDPISDWLYRHNVHPNRLTILGVLGTGVSAVLAARGQFVWAGLVFLLMSPIDALDGPLARRRGEPEEFGAFVDSVSDRYAELMVFGGLLWYAVEQGNALWAMAIYLAAFGSVLVSYVRARAQSLGMEAKVGFITRVERVLIIGPTLLLSMPLVGVAILAVGSNLTAFQRIAHVRNQSRRNAAGK